MSKNADTYQSFVDTYDSRSDEMGWHVPGVIFGLMYMHLRPGQTLLDVGIGTGLGSVRFHKAGLVVHGLDNSSSMLDRCREKGLTAGLVHHDLADLPWPFENESFHHAVSIGVLHFFGDLTSLFSEVSRLVKPGGIFGFDFFEHATEVNKGYRKVQSGVYSRHDPHYGGKVYRHKESYILGLLAGTGFSVLDDTELLASWEKESCFRIITARKLHG
ncbi:MAG: class I SAM-dependent methyltransferase [candidate division Zixibacteria bacterium]|nr:class I SAM-dependent methyltransferase [candidate division Zixibacteria bacterium]